MKESLATDNDYNLWVLLGQTRDLVHQSRDKELKQYGISTVRAGVLFVIEALGDKATTAEISRWMLRKSHTTSELLSRMEKEGLVRKVKILGRKSSARVVLTEKGREAYYQSSERQSIHRIMSVLSEEERKQMRSCLEKLRDKAYTEREMHGKLPFPSTVSYSIRTWRMFRLFALHHYLYSISAWPELV